MKIPIKIKTNIDINLMGKSYIQLDTDKGLIIINNEKESKDFLKRYEVL